MGDKTGESNGRGVSGVVGVFKYDGKGDRGSMSSNESSSGNSGSSGSDRSVTTRSGGLAVSFCFPVDFRRLVAVGCEVDASRGKVPLLAGKSVESEGTLECTGV